MHDIGNYIFTKQHKDCTYIHLCANVANFALYLYRYNNKESFCELYLHILYKDMGMLFSINI